MYNTDTRHSIIPGGGAAFKNRRVEGIIAPMSVFVFIVAPKILYKIS